jgi:hypothetical protein
MKKLFDILIMVASLTLSSCGASKKATYRIDFSGQREYYCTDIPKGPTDGKSQKGKNSVYGPVPKEKYREGEEVVLYFYMVATDTNYTFLLDGEPFFPSWEGSKGYLIRFTMPAHDVKLECRHRNSMIREIPDKEIEKID